MSRPVFDRRDRKRPKLQPLRPPTVHEIHSLVHQHTMTMVLVGSDSRIEHSLMRSWIRCSAKDLKTHSLETLADSLTDRVRGLFCDTTPPSVFKIGLTRDPRWRFYDAPFAYSAGGEFDSMVVLLVGCVALVQWLEAALISRLRDTPGCRNVAPGGESPPPASYPCYLYVVAKPVERVIADQLRIARKVASRIRDSIQLTSQLSPPTSQGGSSVPSSHEQKSSSTKPRPTPKPPSTAPVPSTPSEEPPSSTPWSVVAVLIVAACGLLWLLVKNRK